MSLEAIQRIRAAEDAAAQIKASAAAEAEQAIVSAERNGKALVEAAVRKAEAELQTLARKIDEAAIVAEQNSLQQEAEQEAVLRAQAAGRMEEAAQLILERIVSG